MYKKKKISALLNSNRIYIMLLLIFILMTIIAPNFFNLFNLSNILKGATLGALVSSGFTILLISGYLDLSIGIVINLGAVTAIIGNNKFGIIGGIILSIIAGIIVGVLNGFIVTKGKVHAFIVTLGMMITVKGFLYIITGSGSININDFEIVNTMEASILKVLNLKIIITFLLLAIISLYLTKTKFGRVYFLLGGNRETAWTAGYKVDRYMISAFILSSVMSSIAGMLFAFSSGTAVPNMGEKGVSPQLLTIAAVIIGGTSMNGGKGSIVKSAIAVLALIMLFNGMSCMGTGYEIQITVCGIMLAGIISFESYSKYREDKKIGQRVKLIEEMEVLRENEHI